MKTIAVCAAKGGVGKTSLVALLSVTAKDAGFKVAMIDRNSDQGTLSKWWMRRGEPDNPFLVPEPGKLRDDVVTLAANGFDVCIIDTPPIGMDHIEAAIAVADFVLIPVRPGFFDVDEGEPVIDVCKKRNKPFRILLSCVDTRWKAVNSAAEEALADLGPMMTASYSYRSAYVDAVTPGKVGPEEDSKLKPEATALWKEVAKLTKLPEAA